MAVVGALLNNVARKRSENIKRKQTIGQHKFPRVLNGLSKDWECFLGTWKKEAIK